MNTSLTDIESENTHPLVPALETINKLSLLIFVVFSMFSISITQISFTLGALSWLMKVHLTQSWKEITGTPVGISILAFCLACILATTSSIDIDSSLKHLKKLFQFIIFFWVINTVRNSNQRDFLVKLIIIAGVAATLNGLTPILDNSFSITDRIKGTMSKESTFSGILMITGLIAMGRIIFCEKKEVWALSSMGVIAFGLLITLTRQAWLGFFIGTLTLLFLKNKKLLLIIPLIVGGILLVSPDSIRDRILSFKNIKGSSFQARVSLWEGGWRIFKNYPINGCGFKCVDSIHLQYPDPSGYIGHHRGMHSNIFQLLVDVGIVGLVAWLSIWITYFVELYKRSRDSAKETINDSNVAFLMGSFSAVIGYIVGGFFETNIYDSEVSMLIFFIMGISLTRVRPTSNQSI